LTWNSYYNILNISATTDGFDICL